MMFRGRFRWGRGGRPERGGGGGEEGRAEQSRGGGKRVGLREAVE